MITKFTLKDTRPINILPNNIADSNDTLTSRTDLVIVDETIRQVRLTELIDQAMPTPGSNRGYLNSAVLNTFMMMKHEGGK